MKYDKQLKDIQEAVNKQASEKGGWINLENDDGEIITIVAKHPFYRWALKNSGVDIDYLYPWDTVSPHSMKMINDDPNHSDWMIGAGCDLDEYNDWNKPYDPNSISAVSYDKRMDIQWDELKFESMVLCNGGKVKGRIKHVLSLESYLKEKEPFKNPNYSCTNPDMVLPDDIIVVPHAGVDFELAFLEATKSGAGGVITVIPNKVAHLCKIARERNVTVMCDPDALEKYEDTWCTVTLDPDNGKIEVHSRSTC